MSLAGFDHVFQMRAIATEEDSKLIDRFSAKLADPNQAASSEPAVPVEDDAWESRRRRQFQHHMAAFLKGLRWMRP